MQEKINHLKYVIGERKETLDRIGYGDIVIGADLDTTIRVGEVKSHVSDSIKRMQGKLDYYKELKTKEEKLVRITELSEAGFVPKKILEQHTREIEEFRNTYPRKTKEIIPVSVESKPEAIDEEPIEEIIFYPSGLTVEKIEQVEQVVVEKRKRGRPRKPRLDSTPVVEEVIPEQIEPIIQVNVEKTPNKDEIVIDNITKRNLAVIAALFHENGIRDLIKPLAAKIGFNLIKNEVAETLMSEGRMSGDDIQNERHESFNNITNFLRKPDSQDKIISLIQNDNYSECAVELLTYMRDIFNSDPSGKYYSVLETILFDITETSIEMDSRTAEVRRCYGLLKHEDQIQAKIKEIKDNKPEITGETPRIDMEPLIFSEDITGLFANIEIRIAEPDLVKPPVISDVVKK